MKYKSAAIVVAMLLVADSSTHKLKQRFIEGEDYMGSDDVTAVEI
jgi:hypothetical protein